METWKPLRVVPPSTGSMPQKSPYAIEALSGVTEGPHELLVSSEKVAAVPSDAEQKKPVVSATSNADLSDIALATSEQFHVLVSVADSGSGLNLNDLDQIFDAFYTTNPHGLGMGLSISRSIVKAHGGRLWAMTNVLKGTLLQFTLPIGAE